MIAMTNNEIKERAKFNLGYTIFSKEWLAAVVLMLIFLFLYGLSVASVIGVILLYGPFLYAICKTFLYKTRSNSPISFGNFFLHFGEDFQDSLFLGLLSTIIQFVFSLLLIFPGIIKFYSFSQCYYIKADHPEYTCTQCLDISSEMMKGHKKELFLLDLSFIGWLLLGIVTCGISNLWTIPYIITSRTEYYEYLKNSK